WDGWSPQPLDSEIPRNGAPNPWPAAVVEDLTHRYFNEAARQLGATETNDFIHSPLHTALRQRIAEKINTVTDAVPLASLPNHPGAPRSGPPVEQTQEMLELLGLRPTSGSPPPLPNLLDLAKLEAPLAVQSRARTGSLPFNKFSAMPLLVKAARQAYKDSGGDDVKKALMVVPKCHVKRLLTANGRVTGVETEQGTVPVPANGVVILALGTIESTRLAKLSFGDIPSALWMGQNLMAHLRSNLDIRIPRAALPPDLPEQLQTSALFLKGEHRYSDGTRGHFHLQITASGLGPSGADAEQELFNRIPAPDQLRQFATADEQSVVIAIRAIGEMEPRNPNNNVTLDLNPAENDEFGIRRAYVNLQASEKDKELWAAMDRASDEVAKIFAHGQDFEVFTPRGIVRAVATEDLSSILPYTPKNDTNHPGRRDGLGATHHEAGTLWMGADPDRSVTNADGRFHFVENAYVTGAALFPTIGSPSPMLTSVALVRRLADQLIPPAPLSVKEAGFKSLFDGTEKTFNRWKKAGRGDFA
ncbi:MAG TPA: GMC oxidoreductase, partial [Candidatus Binatia bacterium]|nr:GMC oxidoreductase [Candidatus Binatia bacterium]